MAKVIVKRNADAHRALADLAKKASVKVGWLGGANYDDGTPIAGVAAVQEFGYTPKNIPPRPFMRTTIAEQEEAWKRVAAKFAKRIGSGGEMADLMEGLGGVAAGDIRKKIAEITQPRLKPATIANRLRRYTSPGKGKAAPVEGIEKPLIDSGWMMNTLTHKVGE